MCLPYWRMHAYKTKTMSKGISSSLSCPCYKLSMPFAARMIPAILSFTPRQRKRQQRHDYMVVARKDSFCATADAQSAVLR